MTVYSDNFNRANDASITTGSPPVTWVISDAGWGIASNAAQSASGDQRATLDGNVGSGDMYCRGIHVHRANNNYSASLCVNENASTTWWRCYGVGLIYGYAGTGLWARALYIDSGGDVALAGQTDVQLDSSPSIGETWDVRIESEASGSNRIIRIYINDVEQTAMGSPLTIEPADHPLMFSGPRAVMRCFDSSGSSMAFDEFETGALSDLGTPANEGASTGGITWAGSATGARMSSGAATGSIAWAGTATGVRPASGAASGAIGWAGSATGAAPAGTVPAAVSDLAGTAGNTQVVLTWTAPSDGGSAITDYVVQYRAA